MKYVTMTSKLLTDPMRGIYTVTYYYNDGTKETRQVPMGLILIPRGLV